MAESAKKKKSIFSRIGNWFREVRIETTKRIIWPTFKQVVNNSVIVIVCVIVVGVFIWLFDWLFFTGIQGLTNWLGGLLG
ncbi:MAG: preprotein translocase subunit SecE [Clostridiales bacterium]|nr:MAG: preprotein translocase subunit SecE [Clostridiales bacterium]